MFNNGIQPMNKYGSREGAVEIRAQPDTLCFVYVPRGEESPSNPKFKLFRCLHGVSGSDV